MSTFKINLKSNFELTSKKEDLLNNHGKLTEENFAPKYELKKKEVDNCLKFCERKNLEEKEPAKCFKDKTLISDLYHFHGHQPQESKVLYNNIDGIRLIPNNAEVKIGDLNELIKSHTLKTSRKFKNENSEMFRKLYIFLLNLMFDIFVSITKQESLLPMIGNLIHFLPSTCSCRSEKCSQLQELPSPITKSSQLNKYFAKSDELKSEFLRNAVRVLDWVFRKSKFLNQEPKSIEVLTDARNVLKKNSKIKEFVRIYVFKWICFTFSDEKLIKELEINYEKHQNKFIKTFIAVLINSPFKESEKLEGHFLSVQKYLQYGSILQAAFNYITKNHKVRSKNVNCKCCTCRSNFSPEDIELTFLENVCTRQNNLKEKNAKKMQNFINSIEKNSLLLFKKNSRRLEEFCKKIDNVLASSEKVTKEKMGIRGKRGKHNMASMKKSAKYQKLYDYKEPNPGFEDNMQINLFGPCHGPAPSFDSDDFIELFNSFHHPDVWF